jgi:hypothetical protein
MRRTALLVALAATAALAGCFDGPPFPPGENRLPEPTPSATADATDAPTWMDATPDPYASATPTAIVATEAPTAFVVVTSDRTVDADVEYEPGGAVTVVLTKTSTTPATVTLRNRGRWASVVECTGIDGSEDWRVQTSLVCDSLDGTRPVRIEMGVSPTVVQFVPTEGA